MNHSEQIGELAAALAKAQAAILPAVKDKTNPAFRSRYADLSSVWEACREALTSNGLSVVQMPIDAGEGRVALETVLLHTSGQYLSSIVSTRLVKDDPQGVGSALTYLRRYALSSVAGVVADEDDDGNAASRPQAKPERAQPPQLPSAPASYEQPAEQQPAHIRARDRFFAKWRSTLTPDGAEATWVNVRRFLKFAPNVPEPTTVDGWKTVNDLMETATKPEAKAA